MDKKIQLEGLNRFLSEIYGKGTSLDGLLGALGFEAAQLQRLREQHMAEIAGKFVDVVRARLTWEDKDLYYRLLARRFGLDGEPAAGIESVAESLGLNSSYAGYAESEALQRCKYKNALQDFKKELHRLALEELGRSGERPAREHVLEKLNRLSDLQAAVDLTRMNYEAKRAEILRRVQPELNALEEEYGPLLEAAQANASKLEGEIKNDVLLRGETVQSQHFQAVYVKGRVSWDSAGIGDYAKLHPDVLQFRKEGQPSVSLRTVGGSK